MTRAELENLTAMKAEAAALQRDIDAAVPHEVADIYKDYTRDPRGVVKVMRGSDEGGDVVRRLIRKRRQFLHALHEQIERAEDFIEGLEDPETRAIFRMVYLQDATQAEVAAILGYDPSVISRRISVFWEKAAEDEG